MKIEYIHHRIIGQEELFMIKVSSSMNKLTRSNKEFLKETIRHQLLDNTRKLYISYCYPYMAAYCSNSRVGIDIEKHCHTKPSHMEIYSSEAEYDWLNKQINVSNQAEICCLLWTIKESVGKYWGVGLSYGFQSVRLNENSFVLQANINMSEPPESHIVGTNSEYAISIVHSLNLSKLQIAAIKSLFDLAYMKKLN